MYNLKINSNKLPSVNETTNREHSPQHAMCKLGNVVLRIIWTMAMSLDNGVPILFSKIDLKRWILENVRQQKRCMDFFIRPPQRET